jgi:putative aminopeptidase FrvX
MSEYVDLLKRLSDVHGVSGFERSVATLVRDELDDICEMSQDRLGSIICRLSSSGPGPRVALAGHMDEIGFMVKQITKEGMIKFQGLGGWWDQVLLGQRVCIDTAEGCVLGIIGATPPHLVDEEKRKNVVKADDMFIDIGASDKEQVEALGVKIGGPIVPAGECVEMSVEGRLLGKAWDDRVGVALFIHALRKLSGQSLPCEVFGVGTVQEEVGLRGAATSAFAVKPDVALILETAIPGDVPGIKEEDSSVKLGGGPGLYLIDGSMIANPRLRDLVVETCKENEIAYQFAMLMRGGTDGGRYHLNAAGTPSIVIGVAARHIHSHGAIIDVGDYAHTVNLLCKVIEKLDEETVRGLTEL